MIGVIRSGTGSPPRPARASQVRWRTSVGVNQRLDFLRVARTRHLDAARSVAQFDDLLRVTEDFTQNTGDVTAHILIYRANALMEKGLQSGASCGL
jgi:hypothetical protein